MTALLAGMSAASGLSAYPFWIAYHNVLVPTDEAFFAVLDDSNNDWYQGWEELARLQRTGELPHLILNVSPVTARRLDYGGDWELQPIGGTPTPGLHAMSAFEYYRLRAFSTRDRAGLPLVQAYPVTRVIAGCIVLIDVAPPAVQAPPGAG